jgi:hypothetical protein
MTYFVSWTWIRSCDKFISRLSARGSVKAKYPLRSSKIETLHILVHNSLGKRHNFFKFSWHLVCDKTSW